MLLICFWKPTCSVCNSYGVCVTLHNPPLPWYVPRLPLHELCTCAHTHRVQQDLRVILYAISVGALLVVYCIGHIGACVIYLGSVIPSKCFRLQGPKWMHPFGRNSLFDFFFFFLLRFMGNPQRSNLWQLLVFAWVTCSFSASVWYFPNQLDRTRVACVACDAENERRFAAAVFLHSCNPVVKSVLCMCSLIRWSMYNV